MYIGSGSFGVGGTSTGGSGIGSSIVVYPYSSMVFYSSMIFYSSSAGIASYYYSIIIFNKYI